MTTDPRRYTDCLTRGVSQSSPRRNSMPLDKAVYFNLDNLTEQPVACGTALKQSETKRHRHDTQALPQRGTMTALFNHF